LLFGFTAGEPRVSAYRWCVHSIYAINCGFQTQAAWHGSRQSNRRVV
jgi:hypothetical protein